MKFWVKILLTAIIALTVLFAAAYIFLFFQGKNILIKQLEKATQKKVSIGYFGIIPPLNLAIGNLSIENLVRADSIVVSPSILGFLTGNIAFNNIKLIKPEFTYERAAPVITASAARAPTVNVKKKHLRPVIFKHLKIQDGKINFTDHSVGEKGITITIKEINFNLNNLYVLPRSVITNFELKGKIPWQEGEKDGSIEVEGWLDFFKKDMQATLKIEGIDGVYLYPYYSNWVDLEKARIEKAKLNFTSNIQGLNNNVTAQCHLELTDIVRKPRPPEEEANKAEKIAEVVLGIFRALNQGKIVLDFTIRTKMDQPEFGFSYIKAAFEDKLAQGRKSNGLKVENVLKLPVNILQGTVKSATELTMAVIGGAASIGKELKKAVEETFRREKKEE